MSTTLLDERVESRRGRGCDSRPAPVVRAQSARARAVKLADTSRATRLRSLNVRHRAARMRRSLYGTIMAMAAAPEAVASDGTALRPTVTRTVLVVDDDDSVRASASEVLAVAGHHVLVAEDGYRAMLVLREQHVDVLVLDIRMPGFDGWSVLRQLDRPPPTIVIHSAVDHFSPEQARTMFKAKVVGSLVKPTPPHLLIAAVDEAVRQLPD